MSTLWMIVIIIGGATVVFGNIRYNQAIEDEKTEQINLEAESILKDELKRNLWLLDKYQENLTANKGPLAENFETTGWDVVVNGGLLRGMDESKRKKIMGVYLLMERANLYHYKLIELYTGPSSALMSSETTRKEYTQALLTTLNALKPFMEELVVE